MSADVLKACVIGPNGGIGGYIAAKTAHAINIGNASGWELSGLVHSNSSREAIQDNGLRFYDETPELPGRHNEICEKFPVSADAEELGKQDVIICATSAAQMPVDQIVKMNKPGETELITCLNGLPPWMSELVDVPDSVMNLIDPEGKITTLKAEGVNLVGSVIDVAGVKVGPGEVEGHPALVDGKFVHGAIHLAPIQGEPSALLKSTIELFNDQSGVRINSLKDQNALLRQVWVKLAGNVGANYGAAMYDMALPELLQHDEHGPFLREAMEEVLRVGLKYGFPLKEAMIPKLVDRIIKAKIELKGHFTSTHASYNAGDLDCEKSVIIAPVLGLSEAFGIEMPNVSRIDNMFGSMLKARDKLDGTMLIGEAAQQARLEILGPQ